MVKAKVPMIGKQFGRLTVVKQAEPPEGKKGREAWYLCSCSCGGNVVIRGSSLRRNITKSCGCLQSEKTAERNRRSAEKLHALTGERFGALTAVECLNERKYGQRVWLCKCDCGKYKKVPSGQLKAGGVKSCGCIPKRKPENIAGRWFGRLTVLELSEERKSNGGAVWKCRCDCGKIISASSGSLKRGNTTSCGCVRREELKGMKFGKLTVLKLGRRSGSGRGSFWLCRCDCGRELEVHAHKLKSGHTKSCGCLQRESAIDLSSKRFGKLTVMEDSGDRRKKSGGVIWRCKCDCGQEKLVRQDSLVSGRTTSCGCVKSRGNRKIAEILSKESVNYIPEYSPDDIGGNYRFDFAVFEGEKLSYFIEYDGKQHFEYTGRGWNTEESFFMTEARDKLKDEYCSNKRLPLIRIPYTAFNDILPDDLRVDKSRYLHINVDKDEKK